MSDQYFSWLVQHREISWMIAELIKMKALSMEQSWKGHKDTCQTIHLQNWWEAPQSVQPLLWNAAVYPFIAAKDQSHQANQLLRWEYTSYTGYMLMQRTLWINLFIHVAVIS